MVAPLKLAQIQQFINDGYIRLDHAFPSALAAEVRDILWNDIPFDRSDPRTWTEPVARLGMYAQQPFIDSLNTPELHGVFDQLAGAGRWIPCRSVGTFPVRFPASTQPNDTGKHVDASFPGDNPSDYLSWRVNIKSRGRALLMLVLYSDVGDKDAPTIIDKGSHREVAKLLLPEGDAGLSFMELAGRLGTLPKREQVLATGAAGTVYLCHPLLVHSAQAHTGSRPKFMAQPPLLLRGELNIADHATAYTPVEEAIRAFPSPGIRNK